MVPGKKPRRPLVSAIEVIECPHCRRAVQTDRCFQYDVFNSRTHLPFSPDLHYICCAKYLQFAQFQCLRLGGLLLPLPYLLHCPHPTLPLSPESANPASFVTTLLRLTSGAHLHPPPSPRPRWDLEGRVDWQRTRHRGRGYVGEQGSALAVTAAPQQRHHWRPAGEGGDHLYTCSL